LVIFGAFIVNALVLLNSRGAFVGAFVGSYLFMWSMAVSKLRSEHQNKALLIFIVGGFIALSLVIDQSFIDRISTLSDVEDQDKSGSYRVLFWLIAFQQSFEYPFGVGAYGFEILSPGYVPESYMHNSRSGLKAVHSIWLQVLSEIGWLGFTGFMALIVSTFRLLTKMKKQLAQTGDYKNYYLVQALLSSYLGYLASASFINMFRVHVLYFLTLFTCCLYSILIIQ
jgi:O-antigen ligase